MHASAREWAPHGVRVNVLVPGFFPAEQNRKILQPERITKIMAHTPMNRFGEARELIGATLLLASDTAGSFITGDELVVDQPVPLAALVNGLAENHVPEHTQQLADLSRQSRA